MNGGAFDMRARTSEINSDDVIKSLTSLTIFFEEFFSDTLSFPYIQSFSRYHRILFYLFHVYIIVQTVSSSFNTFTLACFIFICRVHTFGPKNAPLWENYLFC